jgi:hypothetical protein
MALHDWRLGSPHPGESENPAAVQSKMLEKAQNKEDQ